MSFVHQTSFAVVMPLLDKLNHVEDCAGLGTAHNALTSALKSFNAKTKVRGEAFEQEPVLRSYLKIQVCTRGSILIAHQNDEGRMDTRH